MSDTLAALIARVEAATGPDRELDGAIGRALVGFNPDALPKIWPDIGAAPSPWLQPAMRSRPTGWTPSRSTSSPPQR